MTQDKNPIRNLSKILSRILVRFLLNILNRKMASESDLYPIGNLIRNLAGIQVRFLLKILNRNGFRIWSKSYIRYCPSIIQSVLGGIGCCECLTDVFLPSIYATSTPGGFTQQSLCSLLDFEFPKMGAWLLIQLNHYVAWSNMIGHTQIEWQYTPGRFGWGFASFSDPECRVLNLSAGWSRPVTCGQNFISIGCRKWQPDVMHFSNQPHLQLSFFLYAYYQVASSLQALLDLTIQTFQFFF
jgi:hypothetical protein